MTGFTRLALSLLAVASTIAVTASAIAVGDPNSNTTPHVQRDSDIVSGSTVPVIHPNRRHLHNRVASRIHRRADAVARCDPRKRSQAATTNNIKKKAGLAWNGGITNAQKQFYGSKVSWCYSWSAWSCSNVLESVPMMWGNKQSSIDGWKSQVLAGNKHFKNILGFNEPEQGSQSKMTPQQAVDLWWKYMEPANADRRGAPAVTTSPAGFEWLTQFVKLCKGCHIDFFPTHYYGMSVDSFKTAINKIHTIANGKPVWVTEWACQNFGDKKYGECDLGEVKAFLKGTQSWMDSTDWIERYAWFGTLNDMGNVDHDNAMMRNNVITDLGKQYIN